MPGVGKQENLGEMLRDKTLKKRRNVDRTFSGEVRVKRDELGSETNFGHCGSLRGTVGISRTARKLGNFSWLKRHVAVSQVPLGGEGVRITIERRCSPVSILTLQDH